MQEDHIHSECGIPVTDIEIETIRAVLETSKAYWRKLMDWFNASPDHDMQRDIHLIRMLCRKRAYCPTGRQALKVLQLKDRAEAAGFSEQQSRTRRRATRNSTEESAAMPDADSDANLQIDSQDYWRPHTFDFSTLGGIEKMGFVGPIKIADWPLSKVEIADWRKAGKSHPNNAKGIYLIVLNNRSPVHFVEPGTGGHYKNKDPNVKTEILEKDWIPKTCVLYIGKAGGSKYKTGLQDRLNAYMKFGRRKPVPHWGGRYIWQIRGHGELLVYWKELPNQDQDPRTVESLLLQEFEKQYDRLPFANLTR